MIEQMASVLGRIGGTTRLTGIFGDPVEHSRSPAMHNAAYTSLKLDRAYVAFHVKPEGLAGALNAIATLGILGVNLTVPHKERAARLIKNLSAEAKILGAVNCVINRNGRLHGDNSDARGLERDLRERAPSLKGGVAVIVGAGGAAASAVVACIRIGATRIVIANRTPARAAMLARRIGKAFRRAPKLEVRGLDALFDSDLLIAARGILNATSMGLTTTRFARLDYDATSEDCLFYDLIYAAKPTAFLRPAIESGRQAADGAGLLINQGEIAFKLFNRVAPPAGVMRAALFASLGRQFDPE
jgi:shikimate dehydrogenase